MHLTESVEDYLKAIYKLSRAGQPVSTTALKEQLGISPPAVTGMLKRLAETGLVEHQPYRGVMLTPAGERVALEVIRHHRLLESYLAEALGYSWDQVDGEADRLEHAISEEFEDRIAALMGHPATDPHGHPIPTKDGRIHDPDYRPLCELEPGRRAVVRRVSDRDPERLRYLGALGLRPETEVEVAGRQPFGGPLTLRIGDREHLVGESLTAEVFVEVIE